MVSYIISYINSRSTAQVAVMLCRRILCFAPDGRWRAGDSLKILPQGMVRTIIEYLAVGLTMSTSISCLLWPISAKKVKNLKIHRTAW